MAMVVRRVARRLFQSLPGPLDRFIRATGRRVFGVRSVAAVGDIVLEPIDVVFYDPQIGLFVQESYKWPKRVIATSVGEGGIYRESGVRAARLPQAVVAGDGRVFDRDHRLVRESLATHDYQAVNFGRWTQRPNIEIDGLAVNLNWWSGNLNVYHWLRDVFSRAYSLKQVEPGEPLTIIGPSSPTPFQQHGFDALLDRFPASRYIGLEYGHKALVETLLQPCTAPYVRGCGYLQPEVASFVREVYLHGVEPATRESSLTYISRANTATRRLVNEQEVLELVVARLPINVLRIEELAWRDQLGAMMSTNVLAGVYGAGLVHMLFTRKGGVVEIHNGDSMETHFSTLAAGCSVPYYVVQGGPADRMQDFSLSRPQTSVLIAALERAIAQANHAN